jgi:hypothetical protein
MEQIKGISDVTGKRLLLLLQPLSVDEIVPSAWSYICDVEAAAGKHGS